MLLATANREITREVSVDGQCSQGGFSGSLIVRTNSDVRRPQLRHPYS